MKLPAFSFEWFNLLLLVKMSLRASANLPACLVSIFIIDEIF
jgi:hypothetical protein